MGPPLTFPRCPHCEYELAGLCADTPRCPECGGSLAPSAYAIAAARRIARSRSARLVLWASPGIGFFAAIGAIFVRRAVYDGATAMFVCLWAGGTIAVYFSARERSRRNLGKALLIGLPVGLLYFAAIFLIVGAIILLIWLLR